MTDSKPNAPRPWAVHDKVEKASGYRFPGWVVGVVTKRDGQVRYVVEDDRGSLHIFNGGQLRSRTVSIEGDTSEAEG